MIPSTCVPIRLGRKLDFDVECIWKETENIPSWGQIFETEEICGERFSDLEFLENKGKIGGREIRGQTAIFLLNLKSDFIYIDFKTISKGITMGG